MVFLGKGNRNTGGFDVISDTTDTKDENGFSDIISIVSAKTAKFSDTSTMKANAGLKMGLLNFKINTGPASIVNGRTRTIIPVTTVTDPDNAIDDSDGTKTGTVAVIGPYLTVDFGVILTTRIRAKVRIVSQASNTERDIIEYSTDNIIWNTALTLSTPPGNSITHDETSNPFSFRYVRCNKTVHTFPGFSEVFEIQESLGSDDGTAVVNIRSSATIDTADGTIILPNVNINSNELAVIPVIDFLLAGIGQFITLEIISFSTGAGFDVNLEEITSLKEV